MQAIDKAVAVGRNVVAVGRKAVAVGRRAVAVGRNAVAVGRNAVAVGRKAVAVGRKAARHCHPPQSDRAAGPRTAPFLIFSVQQTAAACRPRPCRANARWLCRRAVAVPRPPTASYVPPKEPAEDAACSAPIKSHRGEAPKARDPAALTRDRAVILAERCEPHP